MAASERRRWPSPGAAAAAPETGRTRGWNAPPSATSEIVSIHRTSVASKNGRGDLVMEPAEKRRETHAKQRPVFGFKRQFARRVAFLRRGHAKAVRTCGVR